jgi:membrane-associated phospholipid phosphatase
VNIVKARYSQVRFRFVDIASVSYLSLIAFLLLFFHSHISRWPLYVFLHLLVIFLILEVVRWGEKSRKGTTAWFVRTFYPVAIALFTWGELDAIIPMFFANYWATDVIIRAEKSLFGVLPNVWFQQFYRPWLDELMHIFYSGYYLFMPIVTLTLYVKKKYEAALAAFSCAMFMYFVNFLFFFFFPVLSPLMAESLSGQNIGSWTGYLMADLTRIIQSGGSCRGATFPSSHISAVFVWAFVALRYHRPLGYVLLPLAFGVALGTTYLGYHYALDPIAGFLLAIIFYPVALKILKYRNEDPLAPSIHESGR